MDTLSDLTGRLILVRHAKTHDNIINRICGWTDSAISEEGLAAAEKLAAFVRDTYQVDYLYTSPLQRARITAGVIGLAIRLEPIEEEGLKEMHFGDAEGLTPDEFKAAYPSAYETWQATHDLSYRWPNGELREDFHRRVRETLNRMVGRHPGKTILAVSHGGCIAGYLAFAADGSLATWRDRYTDNCSVSEILFQDGRAELMRFNDVSFLAADYPIGVERRD